MLGLMAIQSERAGRAACRMPPQFNQTFCARQDRIRFEDGICGMHAAVQQETDNPAQRREAPKTKWQLHSHPLGVTQLVLLACRFAVVLGLLKQSTLKVNDGDMLSKRRSSH
jgi:hypothetical protein